GLPVAVDPERIPGPAAAADLASSPDRIPRADGPSVAHVAWLPEPAWLPALPGRGPVPTTLVSLSAIDTRSGPLPPTRHRAPPGSGRVLEQHELSGRWLPRWRRAGWGGRHCERRRGIRGCRVER